MSLQKKVLDLKLEAVMAAKHAQFWQKAIDTHGEHKATEFYKHLGLNHLEAKSFDWEGLKLSRDPKEHEKIAVKGIAGAQESAKESISKILLSLRAELIEDGLKRIKKLKPADYHTLVLKPSKGSREDLRERLIKTHRQGRLLVERELGVSKGIHHRHDPQWANVFSCADCAALPVLTKETITEDEFDDLDMLTDVTDARVANDVQSRITAAASRFALLGLTGAALLSAVQGELNTGSVSYIDRAATGLANKVINIGRSDEAENRKDEWGRVEYSALLDANVCEPCAAEDGKQADNEDDLTPTPNPDCQGGDWCRCFHIFLQD